MIDSFIACVESDSTHFGDEGFVSMTTNTSARKLPALRRAMMSMAALGVCSVVVLGASSPAIAASTDLAEADALFVDAGVTNPSASALAVASAAAPGGPASAAVTLDLSELSSLTDQLALVPGPSGNVPLAGGSGLLTVNQGGAASLSSSPSTTEALAASGAIDPASGDFTGAISGGSIVNLAAGSDALGLSPVTRHILSQVDLEVGTVASRAAVEAYGAADLQYRLNDLGVSMTSPALTELPNAVDLALDGASSLAQDAIEALLPGGTVDLPAGTIPNLDIEVGGVQVGSVTVSSVKVGITAPDFTSVVDDALAMQSEFTSDDGIATVNLVTGAIDIDLQALLGATDGLSPNTEVFTSANLTAISNAVANAINKFTPSLVDGVFAALTNIPLSMSADISLVSTQEQIFGTTNPLFGLTIVSGTLTGSGTLSQFADGTATFSSTLSADPALPACLIESPGIPPWIPPSCLFYTSTVLNPILGAANTYIASEFSGDIASIFQTIVSGLNSVRDDVRDTIVPVIGDALYDLAGAFNGVLPGLAKVVINEQWQSTTSAGETSAGVSAIAVYFLPTLQASSGARVALATSEVRVAPDPTLVTGPEALLPGESTKVQGAGWNPAGGPVTLVFTNAQGDQIGLSVEAAVAPDGSISIDWTAPVGSVAGTVTVTAAQGGIERTAEITVNAIPVPPARPIHGNGLPTTGAEQPLWILGIGAMLALAGFGAMALRARRSR